MSQWVGCMVSIKTGNGVYQGEIISVTGDDITITKTFCNGIPSIPQVVTLRAREVLDLELIEKNDNALEESSIVLVAKPVPKRLGRSATEPPPTTVVVINNSNNSKSKPADSNIKKKSISVEIQPNPFVNVSTASNKKEKPKQVTLIKGSKDEACFGSPLDSSINKEFDFEKNLALFDKQAVWDEIDMLKPDIMKQIDKNKKKKFRHDENILERSPTAFRQILVPKQESSEFVTDDGLVIPTISQYLRNKLWIVADRVGLTITKRVELMGRAATEMALHLLGGGHRLNPHNTHQFPTVILLCGPHEQGAYGVNAARQLASHGVETIVYLSSSEFSNIKEEVDLYRLTNNKIVFKVNLLPNYADLIISALSIHEGDSQANLNLYENITKWANKHVAPVLTLDPPPNSSTGMLTKFSLVPVLPLPYSINNGKVYLCNLGFPKEIFNQVGIKYRSPFGSKFFIPLHLIHQQTDDDVSNM